MTTEKRELQVKTLCSRQLVKRQGEDCSDRERHMHWQELRMDGQYCGPVRRTDGPAGVAAASAAASSPPRWQPASVVLSVAQWLFQVFAPPAGPVPGAQPDVSVGLQPPSQSGPKGAYLGS